jgi:hypothetical protein
MMKSVFITLYALGGIGVIGIIWLSCITVDHGVLDTYNQACVSKTISDFEIIASRANFNLGLGLHRRSPGILSGDGFVPKALILANGSDEPASSPSIRELEEIRRAFSCVYPPMAIYDHTIIKYEPAYAPNCTQTPQNGLDDNSRSLLMKLSDSVGKLQMKYRADSRINQRKNKIKITEGVLWSTGFVVADRVIATTCHALAPIMVIENGERVLQVANDEEMVITFSSTIDGLHQERDCKISRKVLRCSAQEGLDIALLGIDEDSCKEDGDVPDQLSLYDGDDVVPVIGMINTPIVAGGVPLPTLKIAPLAVVAYGDVDHSVDSYIAELYGQYRDHRYDKFLLKDLALGRDECVKYNPRSSGKGFSVLLDIANTTAGESGGVLIDLEPSDVSGNGNGSGKVVGVHTCCSTFFSNEKGEPPRPELPCARLKRTFDNQAVSSWSILHDDVLCGVLKTRGVKCDGSKPFNKK